MAKKTKERTKVIIDAKWYDEATDYYVAFIDIIGFSSMIKGKNDDKLNSFLNVLKHWKKTLEKQNIDEDELHFKSISDSIIIYTQKDNFNLEVLMLIVQDLQAQFLHHSILTRGGISSGKVYFDKELDILLGDGIVNAYQLEKRVSEPKVIIDPKIIIDVSENNGDFIHKMGIIHHTIDEKSFRFYFLKSDPIAHNPGYDVYIDYAAQFILESYGNYHDLNELYKFVKDSIYITQIDVPKYYWLKKEIRSAILTLIASQNEQYLNKDDVMELRNLARLFDGI